MILHVVCIKVLKAVRKYWGKGGLQWASAIGYLPTAVGYLPSVTRQPPSVERQPLTIGSPSKDHKYYRQLSVSFCSSVRTTAPSGPKGCSPDLPNGTPSAALHSPRTMLRGTSVRPGTCVVHNPVLLQVFSTPAHGLHSSTKAMPASTLSWTRL